MANANDLQKRIQIWKYDRSINAAGTPVEGWKFYKYTYAFVKVVGGGTQNANPEGDLPTINVSFIIRYDKEISYNCEIRYNDLRYKILYIEDDGNNFYNIKTIMYNEYQ